MAKFKKGAPKPPTSGRKKGVQNVVTKELRSMLRAVLDQAGGEAYLLENARHDDPRIRGAFLRLLGQTLEKHHVVEAKVREIVDVRNFTNLDLAKLSKLGPTILAEPKKESE